MSEKGWRMGGGIYSVVATLLCITNGDSEYSVVCKLHCRWFEDMLYLRKF